MIERVKRDWPLLARPALAGLWLAFVELLVICRAQGSDAFVSTADWLAYGVGAVGITVCCCLGAWALGSWLIRWADLVSSSEDSGQRMIGAVVAICGGAMSGWFVWRLTATMDFKADSIRWALAIVVASVAGFGFGWLVARVNAQIRNDGGSWRFSVISAVLAAGLVMIDATWDPTGHPGVHLGLALSAVLCAVLAGASAPEVPRGPIHNVGTVLAVLAIPFAVGATQRLRDRPAAQYAVESFAPVSGKVVRSLVRAPHD